MKGSAKLFGPQGKVGNHVMNLQLLKIQKPDLKQQPLVINMDQSQSVGLDSDLTLTMLFVSVCTLQLLKIERISASDVKQTYITDVCFAPLVVLPESESSLPKLCFPEETPRRKEKVGTGKREGRVGRGEGWLMNLNCIWWLLLPFSTPLIVRGSLLFVLFLFQNSLQHRPFCAKIFHCFGNWGKQSMKMINTVFEWKKMEFFVGYFPQY